MARQLAEVVVVVFEETSATGAAGEPPQAPASAPSITSAAATISACPSGLGARSLRTRRCTSFASRGHCPCRYGPRVIRANVIRR